MKKGLMLIMVMMISSVMFAQHRGHDPLVRADRNSEALKSVLSLNDAQYATIKDINRKYAEKYVALKQNSGPREEKHETFKALHNDHRKEIEAVLTPEQKTSLNTFRAERHEKRKQNLEKRISKHEAQLKSELALSDDQFAKLQAINKDFVGKMKALHESDNSPADKSAFKQLRSEHHSAVKGILTQEQWEKWNTIKAEKRKNHIRKK
jgi:periplasmic protein CpxP/Spy